MSDAPRLSEHSRVHREAPEHGKPSRSRYKVLDADGADGQELVALTQHGVMRSR